MRLRFWVFASCASALGAFSPGGGARADTGGGTGADAGAIAGGLFTSNPFNPVNFNPVKINSHAVLPARQMGKPLPLPLPSADADPCGPAIAGASASHHLPPGLLNAIATVESGRLNPRTGFMKPWPWTIDANGAGYVYATEQAAIQAASAFQAAGINSLDIGCLQVNLAQHPDAFQNLAEAFDPVANAGYAAGFLTSLQQKFQNWPQAVAAYHSQTPALGGPYQARVYAQWQSGASYADAAAPAQALQPLVPVLPPTAFQISSLAAPMHVINQGGAGMTGRGLASYRASPVPIASSQMPPG